jgi:hypothetical protein
MLLRHIDLLENGQVNNGVNDRHWRIFLGLNAVAPVNGKP